MHHGTTASCLGAIANGALSRGRIFFRLLPYPPVVLVATIAEPKNPKKKKQHHTGYNDREAAKRHRKTLYEVITSS